MSERHALVVDDSRSARMALRKYLERYQYAVSTAENGSEALGYLRDHHPRVIFLDHLMPGATGLDVLRAIKMDPTMDRIPVVMCTSVERPDLWEEALRSGAVQVLSKPPDHEVLQTLLKRVDDDDAAKVASDAAAAAAAAEPPPAAGSASFEITGQAALHLFQLMEDLVLQNEELKGRLARLEGAPAPTAELLRRIAREEAADALGALRQQFDPLRHKLDRLERLHLESRSAIVEAARDAARADARAIALDAANEGYEQLVQRIAASLLGSIRPVGG